MTAKLIPACCAMLLLATAALAPKIPKATGSMYNYNGNNLQPPRLTEPAPEAAAAAATHREEGGTQIQQNPGRQAGQGGAG
jgi:hypothetical protein